MAWVGIIKLKTEEEKMHIFFSEQITRRSWKVWTFIGDWSWRVAFRRCEYHIRVLMKVTLFNHYPRWTLCSVLPHTALHYIIYNTTYNIIYNNTTLSNNIIIQYVARFHIFTLLLLLTPQFNIISDQFPGVFWSPASSQCFT